MMTKKVILPPFHEYQQLVADDPSRFKVLVAGRRFGKSLLALFTCIDRAVNYGEDVWFVSPTYNNVQIHWRNAKRMVEGLATYKNEQLKYMEFDLGDGRIGSLGFKSGDRPDNLLGVGLDYVVVDEAAYQSSEVWYRVLRPALSDRQGKALIISTPNGVANWFYRAYLAGQDPDQHEWRSWRFRTVDNTYIKPEEIEMARKDLPDLKFRQEYLAEFVSDAGGVFRGLEDVAVLDPLDGPVPGDVYYAGVDWGRKNDFTVVSVFNQDGDQVYIERFTEIGWQVQYSRLNRIYETWGIHKFVAEANAVGSANIEHLQDRGLPVEPVYMQNNNKTALVERLAANIEQKRVRLLSPKHKLGDIQLGELQSYSIQRTRNGLNVTYNAPTGWHDDMVIAALLGSKHIYSSAKLTVAIQQNTIYRPDRVLTPEEEMRLKSRRAALETACEAVPGLAEWVNEQVSLYRKAVGEIPDEDALRMKLSQDYIKRKNYAKSN